MSRRDDRHDGIKRIVRNSRVRTQQEIVDALTELGYQCTQATVSRDVTELGLRKAPDGTYVLAEDMTLRRLAADMVTDIQCAGNLVIIKTMPGTASGVAAAIDAVDLPEVIGTVAGDDTILAVCGDADASSSFSATMELMRSV